jgi:hypothetical protein
MIKNFSNISINDNVSYFASPGRSKLAELYKDVDEISCSPLINELLAVVPNLFLVLNSNRQIITVNYAFLSLLGLDNSSDLLGLRFGEAINCNHCSDMPAGCGTSKYCSSCGAAISFVTALDDNKNIERFCSILATHRGVVKEYFLSVKSSRIVLNQQKYLMVFVNDLTEQQKRFCLERTFFGDITNLINVLNENIGQIIHQDDELAVQCSQVKHISKLIYKEVEYQKAIFNPIEFEYQSENELCSAYQMLNSLKKIFENNTLTSNIKFSVIYPKEDIRFISDGTLIMRILMHMLINAFEHSYHDSCVRLWTDSGDNQLTFKVWNDGYITEEDAIRIFQKYFTTYNTLGRGLGTYFMKYFGEKILGGHVEFTTSRNNGTTFIFTLPIKTNDYQENLFI